MAPEDIRAQADEAAEYFRALLKQDVPPMAAIQLTQTWAHARLMIEANKNNGDKPWEK